MLKKKTLKSLLVFTENQHPAPSFILIYLFTWLAWHNQVISHFFGATGDFWSRIHIAFSSLEKNQYLVVLLLTCVIFILRLAYSFLRFKSAELLNASDDDYASDKEGKDFEKNEDIAQLMTTLTAVQKQLAAAKEREKKAISERNEQVKKVLAMQVALEEARADIAILSANRQSG
ncbi:hypothetical protein GCM10009111_33890 [Colwellia asteriadis]|uniref:Uncharacterized protein n=1 Tax=Colwellia asteriadis TaxID=517723 RepID=A0ABN1LB81_9GAMM